MSEEWETASAELHFGPDGRIRVFGLNDELIDVLALVSGEGDVIARRRAVRDERARERNERKTDAAEAPSVPGTEAR